MKKETEYKIKALMKVMTVLLIILAEFLLWRSDYIKWSKIILAITIPLLIGFTGFIVFLRFIDQEAKFYRKKRKRMSSCAKCGAKTKKLIGERRDPDTDDFQELYSYYKCPKCGHKQYS